MIKPLNTELWIEPEKKYNPTISSFFNQYYPLSDNIYLIMNGLTGAIDAISEEIYLKILNSELTELQKDYPRGFKHLFERGYFFDNNNSELQLRDHLINKINDDTKLERMTFLICPTDFCPMGCKYCFTHNYTKESAAQTLSKEQIVAAFSKMNDIIDINVNKEKLIVLYGGEPFQQFTFDTIEFIFSTAKKNGFYIAGFTNGLNLDQFVPLLNKYKDIIKLISVTLDPPSIHNRERALNNSFQTIVKNIDLILKDENFPLQIKSNVSLKNIELVPELIEFYKQKNWWEKSNILFELNPIRYGNLKIKDCANYDAELSVKLIKLLRENNEISKFDIIPVIDYKYYYYDALGILKISSKSKVTDIVKVPKVYHCPAVSGHFFIFDAKGNIFLCNEEIGNKSQIFGDFSTDMYSIKKEKFNSFTKRKIGELKACDTCVFSFICGGGCACYAKDINAVKCPTIHEDISSIIDNFRIDILNHLDSLENYGN